MQPTPSRFLKVAVPAPVSRYLVAHPKFSRFVARIPGVSRFFRLPAVATVPHITPTFTRKAKPRPRPRYGL